MGDLWTHFLDMNSGGGKKHKRQHIFIQAKQEEAKVIFYNRFGTNPERVSCTCCGSDYSISDGTLINCTGYHRGCAYDKSLKTYVEQQDPETASYRKYMTQEEFEKSDDVLMVRYSDIKDGERHGSIPEQGYVWKG